jgi:hypothetical protein
VSAALYCGRNHALRVACTDTPKGPRYTKALSQWLEQHFGSRPLPKQTRYWAILLYENLPAIEKWRQSLSERERQKLINPQSVVRRWLRAAHPKSKRADDAFNAATVAWRRFVACVSAMPSDQARLLWQAALSEARSMTMPTPLRQVSG